MLPVRPTAGLNGLRPFCFSLACLGNLCNLLVKLYIPRKRCQSKQWLSSFCFLDGSDLRRSFVSNSCCLSNCILTALQEVRWHKGGLSANLKSVHWFTMQCSRSYLTITNSWLNSAETERSLDKAQRYFKPKLFYCISSLCSDFWSSINGVNFSWTGYKGLHQTV